MKLDPATLRDAVTVADGAWSTQLIAHGLPARQPAELANLSRPDLVLTLAHEYVAAGSRFLSTNTFGANRTALARRGVTADVAALNRAGAEIARQAIGDQPVHVVGVIGPSAKILAVRETTEAELLSVFGEQAAALAAAGVDAILLETFSELAEIQIALRAVRQVATLPVIACMSFDSGPQRTRTMMGAEASECAAALDEAGADIIGCNCGAGVAEALPAVFALRQATSRPLWVKPSAGLPELEDGRPVYRVTPEEFVEPVTTLIDAGANVLGGCCGAGPEHIRRLAAVVEGRLRQMKRE